MQKLLLPEGFRDTLFPEASIKANTIIGMLNNFTNFGYEVIEPTLVEFEESLFSGSGSNLKDITFRFSDQKSNQMLGLRADITTQLERIIRSNSARLSFPGRFSYYGKVLRSKTESLHARRELTQAGIELIGSDSVEADKEIIFVTIDALKSLNINNLCIDFTCPFLLQEVIKSYNLSYDEEYQLNKAIDKKDFAAIRATIGDDKIEKLASIKEKEDLSNLEISEQARIMCNQMLDISRAICASLENIDVTIDLLEAVKFPYHTSTGFSLFSKDNNAEIGRGGRYIINNQDKTIDAVGFSFYVEELLTILPKSQPVEKIYAPKNTGCALVKDFINNGYIVINALEDNIDEAKKLGCSYIIKDGQLENI